MTLPESISTLSRANVQEPKKGDTPEMSPEEEAAVASRADDAQPILSEPIKTIKYKRKKPWSQQSIQAIVLGALLIAGIAALIGVRYLTETFGAN